jgi:tRNA threonylcarbamoyladenosine dehydratase
MAHPLAGVQSQKPSDIPESEEEFYAELTRRNRAFIPDGTQKKLKGLKMLVAGCGSTGGACTQSLARVGVTQFILADSGRYELNNLNRQHAYLNDLGKNKAAFHAEQIMQINPFAKVETHTRGVTPENAEQMVQWADLIMDGVDVTTQSGIQMKVKLHEMAKKHQKPVLAGLDLGFRQWGKGYDYRKPGLEPLGGIHEALKVMNNPIKALFTIVPLRNSPAHCLELIRDLLTDPHVSASQLGCTSDLLSSIIVPSAIRFVETGKLVSGWNVDLEFLAHSPMDRLKMKLKGIVWRAQVIRLINKLS